MLRTLPGACFSLVVVTISMAFIEYSESENAKSASRIVFIVSIVSFLLFYSVGFSSTPWAI